MMNETIIIIEDVDDPDVVEKYSGAIKGAGYHFQQGLHTFTYELEQFEGALTLQGTLQLFPGDDDWVDIDNTRFDGDYSTNITSDNFSGNFIWIRCKYLLTDGVIRRVRCNY